MLDTITFKEKQLARKRLLSTPDSSVVKQYEKVFADMNGSRFAVSFSSGGTALRASAHALGLKPGNEIIVPGYTCPSVWNAFKELDLCYADIELDTYSLPIGNVRHLITEKTGAIVLQHLHGLVARDYEEIIKLNVPVIEDCAQALWASYKGVKVGNRGLIGVYSTGGTKNITTVSGGMAVTDSERLHQRLREYRNSLPQPSRKAVILALLRVLFKFVPLRTYTISDSQLSPTLAEIGLSQLETYHYFLKRRRHYASQWKKQCLANSLPYPKEDMYTKHAYLRFPTRIPPDERPPLPRGTTYGFTAFSEKLENSSLASKNCIELPCL